MHRTSLRSTTEPSPDLWRRAWYPVLLLWLAFGVCGCGMARYMKPVQAPRPIGASTDSAVVVFVHRKVPGSDSEAIIMDDQGRYLGTSVPGCHYAVALRPGSHTLVSVSEDSRALQATLEAGRVYYVQVEPEPNAPQGVLGLFAMRPDSSRWQANPQWLAQTRQYEPDLKRGQIALHERQADLHGAIARAR